MSPQVLKATELCSVRAPRSASRATSAKKRCTHKHKHANIQTGGKVHRKSLPNLEAEIMRATVAIQSMFSVKSKFSRLQDSTESWKSGRSGKGHPYRRWSRGRQFAACMPALKRRSGVCGDGGKLNPIWWIWETKWSSSWWSSHTSSCKSEDCSSREMSIVWKCHLHCRALLGLLEAAIQLH